MSEPIKNMPILKVTQFIFYVLISHILLRFVYYGTCTLI